jgi:hypothetical protein
MAYKTRTVTLIKADPGYKIAFPYDDPENPKDGWLGTSWEPVAAWEIQTTEEWVEPYQDGDAPDVVHTIVQAIGLRGGRTDCETISGPVGIIMPDGACYDADETFGNEEEMLKRWNYWLQKDRDERASQQT